MNFRFEDLGKAGLCGKSIQKNQVKTFLKSITEFRKILSTKLIQKSMA